MNLEIFLQNLANPALLFFLLGIIASRVKSDLEIPASTTKFISLYLLFAIGFKGGQGLMNGPMGQEILWSLLWGVGMASLIPLYSFFLMKRKLGIDNAGAIAASLGSVSAVTFVTAAAFLELRGITYSQHMVAVMATMEAPPIVVGVLLIDLFGQDNKGSMDLKKMLKHSFTNGSVMLIAGSFIIGMIVSKESAAGIKPFTTDLFKGFLMIFILDKGISSGKKLAGFLDYGLFPLLMGTLIPLINGSLFALASRLVTDLPGNQVLFGVLAASASYIAVPSAMQIAAPRASQSLYIPLALGVTFPFNIILGIPWYYYLALNFGVAGF